MAQGVLQTAGLQHALCHKQSGPGGAYLYFFASAKMTPKGKYRSARRMMSAIMVPIPPVQMYYGSVFGSCFSSLR